MKHIRVRFAQETDTELLMEFIRELADYEKLTQEVTVDPSTLRESLFGEKKAAEALLAEADQKPVGFAVFFHNFSTFVGKSGIYLEDLYVKPAFRRQGVGLALLSFLAKLVRTRGCSRLVWTALDWNRPALDFYEKLGAACLKEWKVYRIDGANLEALANISQDQEK